ncbi:hypothetical protein HanXRQr2_Chr07g0315151 [Helianthus annuus]|uniref:Uncharacterized protein n=1 Tax=Helianthus annuus TaxID=4232 RepID=A0A9K3INX7_HELAN|nr:hypothetical protein HanXRQr2_Chr07g0315151 [Helianthus annuus]
MWWMEKGITNSQLPERCLFPQNRTQHQLLHHLSNTVAPSIFDHWQNTEPTPPAAA